MTPFAKCFFRNFARCARDGIAGPPTAEQGQAGPYPTSRRMRAREWPWCRCRAEAEKVRPGKFEMSIMSNIAGSEKQYETERLTRRQQHPVLLCASRPMQHSIP